MSSYVRHLRARRARGDRGATLIEAAIVFPVFFLIVLAIIEFGFYMAASSSTTSATRDGARVGSVSIGPASTKSAVADTIRDRVVADLGALTNQDTPVRLWVYKAFTDGSPCVDVPCASGTSFAGSASVACPNIVCYQYTGWNSGTGTFANPRVGGWTNTDACPPTLDTVGVHLQVTHDYLSGVLGSSTTLNEKTVMRIEPLPTLQCTGP